MAKKSISSVELAALVNELQFIIRGKVSQIYHQENEEFVLQLHAPGQGKQLLKIVPGKFLCLTDAKDVPLRPSGFCMQLRKYLSHASINDMYQQESERIVIFELEKLTTFFLIVELFSKGNIILTDKDYMIITVLDRQIWKDRTVKPGEKYLFPTPGINWKKLTENKLVSILHNSDKKNLATTLATEIGLGGVYAEELCRRSGVDKDLLPTQVSPTMAQELLKELTTMIKQIKKPQGFIYAEQVTPFPLLNEIPLHKTKTYNKAISTLNPFNIVSPYDKKIKALERTIAEQQQSIHELETKMSLSKQKGELIYEKYMPLQKLLEIVKELKKNKDWNEIALELKKEKKIKAVDLKHKKIIIDL
ncbi:MAG: NFACT family protein [Nanoarchaeota archaeon]|nr:NFACT family protein [Nanoarchaeota archaeon]